MKIDDLIAQAIAYDAGDPRRVQHFMKVYAFSHAIGQAEGLEEHTQKVLDAAAVLHDIGIHEAERLHGSSAGKWQESEGPAVAAPMLQKAGANGAEQERVLWLIAHHHTYDAGEALDFRILLEADFLVNAYEDELPREACEIAAKRIFRTETGRRFLQEMYLKEKYRA
ncbi:HD domain-containing protein [Butyricicoccus sp. Marseille-Q5471]|uniref:HD domain-containing protein n=1 Tax=Butyricicoccus sp. Marseille-Q5471 TaxID=3039493 RepID=UPI0024BC6572|nr:HD domain-containing protein [Butyricicoccus sp. Marseille-Q5471]